MSKNNVCMGCGSTQHLTEQYDYNGDFSGYLCPKCEGEVNDVIEEMEIQFEVIDDLLSRRGMMEEDNN